MNKAHWRQHVCSESDDNGLILQTNVAPDWLPEPQEKQTWL